MSSKKHFPNPGEMSGGIPKELRDKEVSSSEDNREGKSLRERIAAAEEEIERERKKTEEWKEKQKVRAEAENQLEDLIEEFSRPAGDQKKKKNSEEGSQDPKKRLEFWLWLMPVFLLSCLALLLLFALLNT